jgi:hypothetical protein
MALRVRHVGLKVVSILLAVLLWVLVSGEQTVERALRVPLEFTNLPQQLELVGEPPAVVDVRLRGSSGTMSRIAAGELAAVLDVRSARAGQRLFHLTTGDVRAPFGVEVVQVAPASVPLTFEESLAKTVPFLGAAFGFRLGDFFPAQGIGQILFNSHMRIKRIALEHHGDITLARRYAIHLFASNPDCSRTDRLQTRDRAQQG